MAHACGQVLGMDHKQCSVWTARYLHLITLTLTGSLSVDPRLMKNSLFLVQRVQLQGKSQLTDMTKMGRHIGKELPL